ncbi:hypothetical protein CKALI_03630 [Corynebacterium kalinowskii]|uniref:Uncharacterized protein n=1 Tax=Corynebacterium kalinowskii TaxID=2675216 RepID=A0A6B8VEY2_9CORY|nr:hypothetical protein [Corynebacterium kalinowskii]QGU01609.1 hypothetical protein CKALI_03630 [Corynebacterium kalinowskii]
MSDVPPRWTWIGNELFDSPGRLLATVRSDVIDVDGDRLLIECSPGPLHFRARATSTNGEVFTVSQRGFTVSTLIASCGNASYILERTSVWRKERCIRGASGPLAYVRPMISGKVEMVGTDLADTLPDMHAVFLSWACVLVDSPVRRPRV